MDGFTIAADDGTDMHAWEYSKENILPTRRGRKVTDIAVDAAATQSAEVDPHAERLRIQEEAWREQIQNAAEEATAAAAANGGEFDEGYDPLKLWVRFLRWHEQSHPRGSDVDTRNGLFEDCIEALLDVPRYQDDARFFTRVVEPYAALNPVHARTLYAFLDSRRLFETAAPFYVAWALAEEMAGRVAMAARVYQLGLDRRAQPADLVHERREQFRLRTAGELGADDRDDAEGVPGSATTGHAYTLAPVDERGDLARGLAFHSQEQSHFARGLASSAAARAAAPQTCVAVFDENNPNAGNTSAPVAAAVATTDRNSDGGAGADGGSDSSGDGDGGGAVGDDDGPGAAAAGNAVWARPHAEAWRRFGRLAQNKKENTMKATKWTEGPPLPLGRRAGAVADALGSAASLPILEEDEAGLGDTGFTVFDENPQLPAHLAARASAAAAGSGHTGPSAASGSGTAATADGVRDDAPAMHAAVRTEGATGEQAATAALPAPVVSSTDFFANIFQDAAAPTDAQAATMTAAAATTKRTRSRRALTSRSESSRTNAGPSGASTGSCDGDSGSGAVAAATASLREAMLAFYAARNPEKAAHVDMFLQRFKGKEHHIAKTLRKKYPDAEPLLRNIEAAGAAMKKALRAAASSTSSSSSSSLSSSSSSLLSTR